MIDQIMSGLVYAITFGIFIVWFRLYRRKAKGAEDGYTPDEKFCADYHRDNAKWVLKVALIGCVIVYIV